MIKKALITGGVGFIGSNLAVRLVQEGYKVILFDNFSRFGTMVNAKSLQESLPKNKLEIVKGDVRNYREVLAVLNTDVVFHLAAQTAVTTSVINPREDLQVNILGTFNILEAARSRKIKPVIIYSSTNKVYGNLEWMNKLAPLGEETNLDFHSPYGVSKGAAESYVKDYYRIYGIPTAVFRQSCIYGPRQLGVEDQGWVAHLAARAILDKTINIFGDGEQVRDLLYVDDLIEAYLAAVENINEIKGEVFNIGGGEKNAVSVNSFVSFLEKILAKKAKTKHFPVRPGDQRYFVSDNRKAKRLLSWQPKTLYTIGIPKMIDWIRKNESLFREINKSGKKD